MTMPTESPSCREAVALARLIDMTGQIDDLIDVEGMEQDLADLADALPLPTGIPRFAETVDLFRGQLSKPPKRRSLVQIQQLTELSGHVREQAARFLTAANANCLVAVAARIEQVASHR